MVGMVLPDRSGRALMATAGPHCIVCGRRLRRPKNAPPDDGETNFQKELCWIHAQPDRRPRVFIEPYDPCVECGHPLRPAMTTPEQYPGTVRHHGAGCCRRCYPFHMQGEQIPNVGDPDIHLRTAIATMQLDQINTIEQLPPRPADLDDNLAMVRDAVEGMISERRRRGIQPAGVLPEKVLQVTA